LTNAARSIPDLAVTPASSTPIPCWARAACPDDVVSGVRAAWGFTHETWIVTRAGGRALAVQRRRDRSDPTRPGARAVREALRAAGLPVPEPSSAPPDGAHAVMVLPLMVGEPAAALLGRAGGAEEAGVLCAGVAAQLAGIVPDGLGLPRTWASGRRLGAAGRTWVSRCAGSLHARSLRTIDTVLETAAAETDLASGRLVHGDLAPVNILVQHGRVTAILDLDRARVAHPLFDAAWFMWVVTHHHPQVAEAAWRGYARGARLPLRVPTAFAWLQPLQLLERAATAQSRSERDTWAARLEAVLDERASA
jgi:aminoglycoside phosphotransferase (APT) family kinase protein